MTRPLLVLDLDETLIHASVTARPCDFRVGSRHVSVRPGVASFLTEARQHFDLAVWTARTSAYANCVVRKLLPRGTPLAFVWSVEQCHQAVDLSGRTRWFKDLERVRAAGFPLQTVAILDDAPDALIHREARVLAISPYSGAAEDDALEHWTLRLAQTARSLR